MLSQMFAFLTSKGAIISNQMYKFSPIISWEYEIQKRNIIGCETILLQKLYEDTNQNLKRKIYVTESCVRSIRPRKNFQIGLLLIFLCEKL